MSSLSAGGSFLPSQTIRTLIPTTQGTLCPSFTVLRSNFLFSLDVDPYLQYKPEFARSLPIQILVIGIVLTLVAVLLIHIIFTAQYHWPLAPVNYILQLSGVITLLISLIATLHVVLSTALSESEKWPYMLSYIAVNVPPMDLGDNDDSKPSWSLAERATWLIMNATVSGLIQVSIPSFSQV